MSKHEEYTKTYSTYSGCDIVATFNGKVLGELQAITYSISREKAPVYTMGSPEPRSFSRGKRGIAGTMVFTVFSRDALIDEMGKMFKEHPERGVQKFLMNDPDTVNSRVPELTTGFASIEDWDTQMTELANGSPTSPATGTISDIVGKFAPRYADEILPFDVTVTFANDYGQKAVLVIYGVELLNEGTGFSIDTVISEKAYTFVARRIDYMRPSIDGSEGFSSTW